MFARILMGSIGVLIGILFVVFTNPIVDFTGRNSWAENFLGGAGTYTLVKVLGIIIIILSFFYITGTLQAIGHYIIESLFGASKPL